MFYLWSGAHIQKEIGGVYYVRDRFLQNTIFIRKANYFKVCMIEYEPVLARHFT